MAQIAHDRRWILIPVLAALLLAGAIDSYKIFKLDTALWSGARENPSFCNVSEFVNCDAVSLSDYSTMLGIPNSLLAFGFYTAFLVLLILGSTIDKKLAAYFMRLLLLFGILSSILGIYLASISILVIDAFCILCCVLYLINFSIVALTILYLKENPIRSMLILAKDSFSFIRNLKGGEKAQKNRPILLLMIYAIFLFLSVILIFSGYKTYRTKTGSSVLSSDKILADYLKNPVMGVEIEPTTEVLGQDDAPLTIIEFSDFQCPFCRRGAFQLKTLLKQYQDEVRLIFKNYPLDSECNPDIDSRFHKDACMMSKAAICADTQDKFWVFHDFLFDNSRHISKRIIFDKAREEKMDLVAFDACMESGQTQKILDREIEDARNFGIKKSTPVFVINGRKLRGLRPPRYFHEIIKYELNSK